MLFNSVGFFAFFPIVILLYYILPGKVKQYWLLAASYYFYMCWNAKYVFLLLFSTIITYLSGLILQKIKENSLVSATEIKLKNAVVALSFLLNLVVLVYFKYFNFMLDSV